MADVSEGEIDDFLDDDWGAGMSGEEEEGGGEERPSEGAPGEGAGEEEEEPEAAKVETEEAENVEAGAEEAKEAEEAPEGGAGGEAEAETETREEEIEPVVEEKGAGLSEIEPVVEDAAATLPSVPQTLSMSKAATTSSLPEVPAWNDEDSEEESSGWGGWGTFGQAVSAAGFGFGARLTEAAKTMANDLSDMKDTLVEAANEANREDDRIGEKSKDTDSRPGLQADGFEARRAKFLDEVEEKTSRDVGDLKVEEHISSFATGAASFFGSVLGSVGTAMEGGVQNAQKLASSAANEFQETLQQGVSDVKMVAKTSGAVKVASTGLKLAADHTIKLAEMSLEKAGSTAKGILDMTDAITGVDTTPGAGVEEEDLSFSHSFFIYGGSDHMEEIEGMSTKCGKICQNIKVKLSGENKVEYKQLIESLGERFDLTSTELEEQSFEPLGSYSEIRKRAEDCTAQVEGFVNQQMSDADLAVEQQLKIIRNEAVQQMAEQTAFSVRHLVVLSRSIAEPLGLFGDEEDIEWPEDPVNVASVIRSTIKAISSDLQGLMDRFVEETGKFSKGNEELKKPAEDFARELKNAHESAMDKISEALRGMLFIIAAAHFTRD
ncbi:hypothetical protein HOP50_06g41310 [Chloropicon primus]|uniref:DUF7798 domain-containing protein n=1 Tax=Chloropicon primus TaxID=1764295 RepID=A0A5B8MNI9_9CHLO|nr:hypothetical protein A3770_06p41220 [Chloropicon primus]UPR00815.1 hypothetical protein HOP50_06g41310 [Chloropicon primus]|eukprot:QDZ21604.1 hypothetical protein A3770_06p41220 [Chloropicon primus]